MTTMTTEEQKKIFSNNLNKYISRSGKQQKEIAEAIGTNASTFNMWCKESLSRLFPNKNVRFDRFKRESRP